jgi:acid phosphatase
MSLAIGEPLEPRRLLAVPRPDHVVIVVEENRAYSEVIGSPNAPYINSLVASGASLTNYSGLTHPSQPNYIGMFSGSFHNVLDNSVPHTIGAPSLGGQLIAAGLDFAGYSEDLPSVGFTGAGHDGYVRRHAPWVNFSDIPPEAHLPFSHFPSPADYAALPAVSFVIPNLANDMHDGSVRTGDAWLKDHLDPYVRWAKTHNSLFVLTWDEDRFQDDNHIPTIFAGAGVKPGTYPAPANHYSLLRTIEEMYGLPYLGQAAEASTIADVWGPTDTPAPTRFTPSDDAFVSDGAPAKSHGSSRILTVKTKPGRGRGNRDAYFKFDTGPAAGDIAGAKLRFLASRAGPGKVAASVFAVADTGWTESDLTWKRRPVLGALLGTVVISARPYAWFEVDVTGYLKAERAAGRTTVSFALHNRGTGPQRVMLHARESPANPPELVLTPT